MRKAAKFLLGVVMLVVLADVLFGVATRYYLSHYRLPGDYRSIDYVVRDAREQVMILGSSVALNSLMPGVVEDSLGLTCYNGAANGQQFPYYQTMADILFKRYTPRMIVLGITPDVCSSPGIGDRYNILMPYYKTGNAFLDSCMESTIDYAPLLYRSSLIRYNTIWWRILLYHFVSADDSRQKGFVAKDVPLSLPELTETRLDLPMVDERREQLLQLFESCRDRGVELVIYFPPLYTRITGSNRCTRSLEALCRDHGVRFIDDSQDAAFLEHPEWFHDNFHLNGNGARVYSRQFAGKLKEK